MSSKMGQFADSLKEYGELLESVVRDMNSYIKDCEIDWALLNNGRELIEIVESAVGMIEICSLTNTDKNNQDMIIQQCQKIKDGIRKCRTKDWMLKKS